MYAPVVRMNLLAWAGVSEQATWGWFDESGVLQQQATGDVTAILQNAISYAAPLGIPFQITGRSYRRSDGAVPFLCTYGTITVPPVVGWCWDMAGCLPLMRPADLGPGIIVDSSETFHWYQKGGEFLYRGNSAAIRFKPQTPTNTDNCLGMNTADIDLGSITTQAQGSSNPIPVEFDPSIGTIKWNRIRFGQVSGGGVAPQAYRVINPSAGTYFESNQIQIGYLIGTTSAAAQIGLGTANQANIRGNSYDIGAIEPSNANSDGFNTFGSCDRIMIGSVGGIASSANRGLVLEPGGAGNRYLVGQYFNCAGGDVIDAGINNIHG